MFLLSALSMLSSKAKVFVDWLDRIPGFAAAGVGLGVGLFFPVPFVFLLVVGGAYVAMKVDLGSWFK